MFSYLLWQPHEHKRAAESSLPLKSIKIYNFSGSKSGVMWIKFNKLLARLRLFSLFSDFKNEFWQPLFHWVISETV